MVTLKIAGLVIVFVLGLIFAPTYLDFSAPGAALRRAIHALETNPAYPVGLVIGAFTYIPIGMLVAHLMILGTPVAIVVGYLVEFVAMALAGAVLTPPPSYLRLDRPGTRRKSLLDLMDE